MAKRRNKKMNKEQIIISLITFAIILILGILENKGIINLGLLNEEETENTVSTAGVEKVESASPEFVDGEIKIYFWDVGQADSILLTSNNEAMLIDAGNNGDGKTVVNNIKNLGITKLDYIVGTHPHADHIGGLDNVIKEFDIGKIYMPNIETNTKTFEEVLDAIIDKNKKINAPKVGTIFNVGDIKCEIMLAGTGTEEEQKANLNLASIVIRATYGNQSYLFTGDAETTNEDARDWPQTNVLKVGHHGSSTSSSQNFLNQIKPEIAIIQVGEGNDYGHPHTQVIKRLNKIGTEIYRTDENGTIILTSDGKTNRIETEK